MPAASFQRTTTGRIVLASLVGTAIGFYDFHIYGTAAALVLGKLFLPATDASAQSLAAFATFGVAFMARPVGSFLFGMVPPLGPPLGFLLSNGLFLLLFTVLTDAQFAAWEWRIPFLASALLVGVGLYVRRQVGETPAFTRRAARAGQVRVPLGALLPSLFPAKVRCTGASATYDIGGILGASLAPYAAQVLLHGGLSTVGLYISLAAVVRLEVLILIRPAASDAVGQGAFAGQAPARG